MLQDLLGSAIIEAAVIDRIESIHSRRKMQSRDLGFFCQNDILRRIPRRPLGNNLEVAAASAG